MGSPSPDYFIIDSHIHLYASEHIKDLAWTTDLSQDHVLNRQNSVEQWLAATSQSPVKVLGFVFVETDRESGLSDSSWHHALEEISFLARICSGTPQEGEGHVPGDGRLVFGIVPWAPIAAGGEAVNRYLAKAKQAAGSDDVWKHITGFRYLVQDKPRGTMLRPAFTEGLLALEEQGIYCFDLGVDARSGGVWQLQEACSMLQDFYSTSHGRLNVIVNHMCKPNLRLSSEEIRNGSEEFKAWRKGIEMLAGFPTTYMKLSGLFSELLSQSEENPKPTLDLLKQTKPWLDAVFTTFGPSRIMFGSDWPVCNVGGPGASKSWQHWCNFIKAVVEDQALSDQDKAQIWSGTAIRAYKLDVSGTQ